jgi:hypothetical protein
MAGGSKRLMSLKSAYNSKFNNIIRFPVTIEQSTEGFLTLP